MRTGVDYKESLRDGRDVWVVGEGAVADVTTQPLYLGHGGTSTLRGMTATSMPTGRTSS